MTDDINTLAQTSVARIADRTVRVRIIGMGYVGLPPAACRLTPAVASSGKDIGVFGLGADPAKAEDLKTGWGCLKHLGSERLSSLNWLGSWGCDLADAHTC